MTEDFLSSLWLLIPMNRTMMWGIPKYPRPQPRPEMIVFQSLNPFQKGARAGESLTGSSADAAKIGTRKSAPRMRSPWKKSVQQTAEYPPRKVYPTITTAPRYIAFLGSMLVTVWKRFPHALMLAAE